MSDDLPQIGSDLRAMAVQADRLAEAVELIHLRATQPFGNWYPIADAPRDGRRLLLLSRRLVIIGRWDPDAGNWKPKPFWSIESWGSVKASRDSRPTHFMPLPGPLQEPPEGQETTISS